MLNWTYNWSRSPQISTILLICNHNVCCSRLHSPQWSKALLAVTWSSLLSRHHPSSSFPHPLQPWHSYIIAFDKLCGTPHLLLYSTLSNLTSHSSVMSETEETRFPDRLITVCFVTALWNTQLLLSVPSKEREKIPPIKRQNLQAIVSMLRNSR